MKTVNNDMDKNTRVGKRKKRNKAMRIFWSVLAVILIAIGGFAFFNKL